MINANDFNGINDSAVINKAIENRGADGIVIISPRSLLVESERDYWLLDSGREKTNETVVV